MLLRSPSTRTWVRNTSFSDSRNFSALPFSSFLCLTSPASLLSPSRRAAGGSFPWPPGRSRPSSRGGFSGVDQVAGPENNTLRQGAPQAIPSYLANNLASRLVGVMVSFRRSAFVWRGGKSLVAVVCGIYRATCTSRDLSSPFRCLVPQ